MADGINSEVIDRLTKIYYLLKTQSNWRHQKVTRLDFTTRILMQNMFLMVYCCVYWSQSQKYCGIFGDGYEIEIRSAKSAKNKLKGLQDNKVDG